MLWPHQTIDTQTYYKCDACQVHGRGHECWNCGSTEVEWGKMSTCGGSANTWGHRDDGYAREGEPLILPPGVSPI